MQCRDYYLLILVALLSRDQITFFEVFKGIFYRIIFSCHFYPINCVEFIQGDTFSLTVITIKFRIICYKFQDQRKEDIVVVSIDLDLDLICCDTVTVRVTNGV